MAKLGLNEVLILSALGDDELTLAQINERLEPAVSLSDGTIYMALQRMGGLGYVHARKTSVVSADKRTREINLYHIAADGREPLRAGLRDAQTAVRLAPAWGTK